MTKSFKALKVSSEAGDAVRFLDVLFGVYSIESFSLNDPYSQ